MELYNRKVKSGGWSQLAGSLESSGVESRARTEVVAEVQMTA